MYGYKRNSGSIWGRTNSSKRPEVTINCPDCSSHIMTFRPSSNLVRPEKNCPNCGAHIKALIANGYLCTVEVTERKKGSKNATKNYIPRKCCESCGKDISNLPSYYYLCYNCWKNRNKSSPAANIPVDDGENDYRSTENYRPDTLEEALEGDELAYYNLFGEFPKKGDW